MTVDHIGYLSSDINKSIQAFEQIGYVQESEILIDNIPDDNNTIRNVYICFVRNDSTRVELVSPIDEKSDVFFTIRRQGEGPYHICYQVDNLEEQIQQLKKMGWMVLKRPAKAMAFDYSRVVFLFKRGVGMIELVEG
ncbi:MAG: VOC family protein [Eubacteriales bacterium]|nr:VOC family protein [Eubacteriales bacterium]